MPTCSMLSPKRLQKTISKKASARWQRADGWRLRRAQRATQNAPDQVMRPDRHADNDGYDRCLRSTKEVITAFVKLVGLGITVATFIIGIAT